jgi:hypothetical protein
MNRRKQYYYLPKKYHAAHDYSEFVITQIEELITKSKFNELRSKPVTLTEGQAGALATYKGHIYDFLQENGMKDIMNNSVACTLLNSLIMESCYFLQEAYLCSMKRRLTVAFSLFRKPFFEVVIILMRLMLEDDFVDRFNMEDDFDPTALHTAQKRECLEVINILLNDLYVVDDLYEYLFDKSAPDNLYNLGNQSIHLYTGKNPAIKTGKQNLNLIFNGLSEQDSRWHYVYNIMPMLLTFLADLTELTVMRHTSIDTSVFERRFVERDKMKARYKIV